MNRRAFGPGRARRNRFTGSTLLSTHKIYRFMWSNFNYTKTANQSTEPDLLSTRTIVLRGRPSSQHTRATVSCGRTSSKTKPVNRCTGQMLHSTRDIVQWTELALDAIYRFTGSTLSSTPCYLSFHRVELAHSSPTLPPSRRLCLPSMETPPPGHRPANSKIAELTPELPCV